MSQITKWTEEMDQQLRKLFYSSKKYSEIGAQMGLPTTVIQRRLHKMQLFRGTTTVSAVIREPWQPGTQKPDFATNEPYTAEPERPRKSFYGRDSSP